MLSEFIENTPNDGKFWHKIIQKQQEARTELIEIQQHVESAMVEYLKEVGETEDFILTYHSTGYVELKCKGDLFDLEQIGGFCDVFDLISIINNRLVVENYLENSTTVKTNYLFQTGKTLLGNEEDKE